MADGFAATQGSGSTVATDDVAAIGHVQKIKLLDGTADSSVVIPGDANRGLYVNPAKRITRVQVTPTVSSSPAYTSGDQLGGLMSITGASRVTAGGGMLLGIGIMCKSNNTPTMVLNFYSQSITVSSDNAAAVTSDGDRAYQVASLIIAAGNWTTAEPGTPANQFASVPAPTGASTSIGLALPYVCAATTLYCQAMITSATTLATTSDLVFSFLLETD